MWSNNGSSLHGSPIAIAIARNVYHTTTTTTKKRKLIVVSGEAVRDQTHIGHNLNIITFNSYNMMALLCVINTYYYVSFNAPNDPVFSNILAAYENNNDYYIKCKSISLSHSFFHKYLF